MFLYCLVVVYPVYRSKFSAHRFHLPIGCSSCYHIQIVERAEKRVVYCENGLERVRWFGRSLRVLCGCCTLRRRVRLPPLRMMVVCIVEVVPMGKERWAKYQAKGLGEK